ncbi:snRNA-activating protein complex subunit 1-like [Odontesthes bonariensis]|uniref:snRNA-activating protein complex subunit 1-like n=1 Tax=Odontesthes bonariensis TaxID=219752 RepID=UPI003F588CC9
MPRFPPAYSDFFYGPLTEDVEELLGRFQQTDSVRYEDFSAIWRDMRLSDVFIGINSSSELKRFSRITLGTAVKYFLPPYSYQIRVCGLYLMFGFYHTQLATPPLKIRLALRDWTHVQNFLRDSVDSEHYDVIYIYQKLSAAKALHYTAMPHFLTFQKQQKPKSEPLCLGFLSRTTAVQELMSAGILEEMANIQAHYERLKEAVEVNRNVTMTHRDFASRLKLCMSESITGQQKTSPSQKAGGEVAEDEEYSSRRATLLSTIKQKSYSSYQEASKSRRHRQVEVVDSSSSGAEQVREAAAPKKKRPASLRARTWSSLGVTKEERSSQAWLLSIPEQLEGVPMKRLHQTAPCRL